MSDADLSAWNSLLAYANEDAAGYLSHAEFLERLVQHIDRRHIVTYVLIFAFHEIVFSLRLFL